MGDAQSAQRDGKSEAAAQEQGAGEDGPSGECTHDKLTQNNGQISELNGKPDGTLTDVKDQVAKEAVTVEDKDTKSEPEAVTNVQIIQEELPHEEEPIEIINMDAKQNDLNESFKRFFSNIGLKLTVKKGTGDQAGDEAEKEGTEKLDAVEETVSETKYEDVEQTTDLNAIQDNDSTTCPTLTEGTSDDVVAETVEEKITETKEMADNAEGQEANVTMDEQDGNQNHNETIEQSPTNQEEEIVSPIKKFFTTGIFAGLKKKKIEEEAEDKELVDMSKNVTDAALYQQEIVRTSSNVEEQKETECKEVQEDTVQAMEPSEVEERGKSPSADQDSESEMTSSQEKVQSSPFKRLFSGTTFKRRSKRQKGRRSSDSKLSDSGEHIEHQIVASSEKTEQQDAVVEPPSSPPPSTTEPEEELSAWETFKKLMTPKKSLKRASIGSEEVLVQAVAAAEETKTNEGERISDHSTEEGRKRKDSSHSWEAVLCGSGRRRSRKTSDSEDEQKQNGGEVESPNEAEDVRTSTPKQADSPSDSESSTWKSFKKLMTPKRKVKDDEESKDIVQSDSEATQEETLFSIKKLLPGRKKRKSGDKSDQLSSDEGDNKEVVSVEEDSETPAVVPLSEFDKSETEEAAKTDMEIQDSDLESEQEHILEIPKTFVQEVQEHQVTPVIPLNQDQDELTEFSKYQPLSDIPEEGNITETVATSLIEDVAKDDTIAEDMVELTSEAITAPEPVDITMADETEELMLSAASHLTESSKTSGNATPVPVEYDVKETEVLLKEVAETISTATKEDIICTEQPSIKRVVSSVTHEMFERYTSEEQVMEIHVQSDTVTSETGLQVDQIRDTDVELPVTVLSESLSEFKDAISTSEVSKVEFESAKVEIDEVPPAQLKRAVKQESVDDSDYMIESLSEVPESVEVAFDKNVVQDVLPDECNQRELEAVRTESTELMFEEKLEIDNLVAEKSDIQEDAQLITSMPEREVDSVVETDKEEMQEHEASVRSAQINETGQVDQPEAEEIIDVLSLESTSDLHIEVSKEPSNEQTVEELQEVTETNVKVEIVAEDDFEIVYKKDVENTQESALENQNLPEDVTEEVAVQEEETMHMADIVTEEEMTEDIAKESTEQDVIGENEQDVIENQISEINVEADKEGVFITDATTEQESREQPDDVVPEIKLSQVEDATNKLLEEISEEEFKDQLVPSTDREVMEQRIEEVSTEADQQDGIGELEDKPLPTADADEVDDKVEVLETIESLQEMVPEEETNLLNGLVIVSSTEESETISQLDYTLYVNGDPSEIKPSEAHTMQVDQSHEVTEDLKALTVVHVSSISEDSGIAQVLEDTVNIEESSEIFLSTTEEPLHEAHIGEIEVSTEGRFEEEIPCPVTEVAEAEHAALQEESTATLQQVTATMPDLMIQKNTEDSEKIAEETSIPCVDNAEVLHVPKNEVQFTEVEQFDIQGEKEKQIVPPEITNVDVQHTLVAQQSTCTFKDVVSHEPDVSIEKTTTIHEAIFSTVVSEQEEKEAIETTTPLEVNNITQVAHKSTTAVLMHVPGLEFEDNHQVQVQVVNVDIHSAETKVDTALEIGVQENKEVVDSCFETVERVDSFSATSNIEQEMMSEKDQVAIQEVVQHVKELAPELEEQPEDKKLPIDLVDSKLSEDQKMIESHDEKADVAAVQDYVMTTKEQVLTKIDDDDKDVQKQPSTQNQASAPDNTTVAVPQNTGVISSVGNIDAPSSLSLEFKLNIQFGPSRGPTLPSPSTHFTTEQSVSSPPQSSATAPPVDRNKLAKTTSMSEVGVQVVKEETKQENELQRYQIVMAEAAVQAAETTEEPDMRETLKNEELMDVGIQYAEIEEPIKEPIKDITAIEITQNKPAFMDVSTQSIEISEQNEKVKTVEIAVADNQPVLTDVGTQSIYQEEIAENVKTTVEEISIIQIAGTVQPEQDIEEKGVVLNELVVLQDSEDQSKQTEDEDENQDVWMDAEEDINDQEQITTVPLCEIEESFESQPDYFQETKTDFEQSLENVKKIALKCDIDSEGEDFTVAREDPQIETAITTVEWD